MKFKKKLMPLSVALIFCGIVLFTLDDYGITMDESPYFLAGGIYFDWIKNPSLKTIDKYWSFEATSTQHPPLTMLLGEVTKYLFHKKINIFNEFSAFRASTVIFTFFLTLALLSFVSQLYGRKIALIVSVSVFFLPRIFFHSHLAALDYPITAMWFLVVYTYWRGIKDKKWMYLSAILLGFALLTKLNAYFIYISIIFYWILSYKKKLKCFFFFKKSWFQLKESLHLLSKIIPMFIIPLLVFVAFWPYLWKDPLSRIIDYPLVSFKLNILRYAYYLGIVYTHPPWHYPYVLTFITVPLITLIPFFIGLFKIPAKPHRETNIFILFNSLLPLLIISLPNVAKFDDVRLFLPAFPFICIISGLGVKFIFDSARKFKLENLFFFIYLLLFSLSCYHSIIKYHPYQSSYFNEVIGGVDGAEKKGFEVEYWGNAFIGSLPFLNEHSDSTFWVYHHPARYRFYDGMGLLKRTVKFGEKNNSDYLVLLNRKGSFDKEMWRYYECEEPVFSVRVLNTNLLNIYKLR